MNGSFKIGNAFGIPVRIHVTFLLLLYLSPLVSTNLVMGLGLIVLVFGCVLLHELGHSLVARNFGLHVADITLWPLGGIARMSRIPENSRIEALIAVAGPAVNFAIAAIAVVLLAIGNAVGLQPDSLTANLLTVLVVVNLLQGGFNLLPAFPMDGGRLLRAWLGRSRDWLTATEQAVRVGRFVAFLFLVAAIGMMVYDSPWNACVLPLLAFFVWFEGTRELLSVRVRHGVPPFGPGAGFGASWARRPPGQPEVVDVDLGPSPASEPPPDGARRPSQWRQQLPRSGGFSDDEIRGLESHRGPLRRPPEEE